MNCSKQLIFIVPWESLCVSQWLNNIKYPTGKVQPPPSVWMLLWHPWGSNHRVHTICTYLIWSLSRESPLCLYNQKIQLLSTHAKKVKFTAGCRSLFLQLQIFLSFPFFSFFFFSFPAFYWILEELILMPWQKKIRSTRHFAAQTAASGGHVTRYEVFYVGLQPAFWIAWFLLPQGKWLPAISHVSIWWQKTFLFLVC